MQTFILTGGTELSRSTYLHDLVTSETELIHLTAEKTTLTIAQVQDLAGPLGIMPRLPRIVWIEEADRLTTPAQNALLKMLEEPPHNTTFYLTCQSKTSLLSTIRSRARSVILEEESSIPDPKILADLKLVMAMTAGDRLTNIDKRDRSESISWMTELERALKDKLHTKNLPQNSATTLAKIARSVQKAHGELLANCSVGLVTQQFYLTLPHTRSTS